MRLLSFPVSVYFTAGLISILLSLFAGLHVDVINPDGICYLQSAQAMPQGLHFAMNLCGQAKWPLYSILIFAMSKLTHLSVTESSYVLNGLFSFISVLSFIGIIQYCSQQFAVRPGRLVLGLGALTILLAHEFNALKQDVVRDHGFLAFYLLSILFLLNYFCEKQWRYALGWSISLIAATLFRIEGAIFLLCLPFLTAVDLRPGRLCSFLKLQTMTLAVVVILFMWLWIHPSQNLSRLNDFHQEALHAWNHIVQNFSTQADWLGKNLLTQDSIRDAGLVFTLTLLSWYFIQIGTVLTLGYILLIFYGWYNRVLKINYLSHAVLWGYIIINLGITVLFLAEYLFLSKRYLMALCLVLMIGIPFALNHVLINWRKNKIIFTVAFTLILISSLGGICHFGYSKMYIHQAGDWLSQNTPQHAKIYSNDYQLLYYSNHFGDAVFKVRSEYSNLDIKKEHCWHRFDYLALRVDKKEITLNQWAQHEISLQSVQTFSNRRGDEVVIYKVIS